VALPTPSAPHRTLRWPHGEAELHAQGAMLGPVTFKAPGQPDFSPLQVVPWLRGDWPCVPFGRVDRPAGLPSDWPAHDPGDAWHHGHAVHHAWTWRETAEPHTLTLQIDLPEDQPVRRLTRSVRARPGEPALDLELRIEARRPCTLPVALHPTLRLDLGRVDLELAHAGPGLNYPVPAEPGRSRLAAGARFDRLSKVPLSDGSSTDLTHYPQAVDSEDLLQLLGMQAPVTARYPDAGWSLTLDWDRTVLPDLVLWISHRGRQYPPWNGRHFALGLEPVNGAWDLGRVTQPPEGHPLAGRHGLALVPGTPRLIRSQLCARPLP
jgi:hypothetical protein